MRIAICDDDRDEIAKIQHVIAEIQGNYQVDTYSTGKTMLEAAGQGEKYDIACARAVANMPVLMEYCTPFVKVGGRFIAMKGPSANDEVALCDNAIKVLKMEKPHIICEKLPNNDPRTFVIFKKISQTPPKYPRNSGNISKQPL